MAWEPKHRLCLLIGTDENKIDLKRVEQAITGILGVAWVSNPDTGEISCESLERIKCERCGQLDRSTGRREAGPFGNYCMDCWSQLQGFSDGEAWRRDNAVKNFSELMKRDAERSDVGRE